VSQPAFSSQEAFESTEQGKRSRIYKQTLMQIQMELEPGSQLRELNAKTISNFLEDLTNISREVKLLKSESGAIQNFELADMADSMYLNIRKAIIELSLALDLLDWIDKIVTSNQDSALKARRDYYTCLSNCQECIREAVQKLR